MNNIAVVVTCYNLGRTLGESLDSVQAQTREAAEIVIVDDGSTDAYTLEVLAHLNRARTRIFRTVNRGLAAARNVGIRLTTAPYIVPLDADDILDPTYFEKAAARLDAESNLDFVSCALQAFEGASYVWTPPPIDFIQFITRGTVHASTMFRRELWEKVRGFDETFRTYELMDFWVSALELGFRGEILNEPLLKYRVRAESQYQKAIRPEAYHARMQMLFEKHRRSMESCWSDVLVEKEAFLLEQQSYSKYLLNQKNELEREVAGLNEEIGLLAQSLKAKGIHTLQWGDFSRVQPISSVWGLDRGQPVDRYYIEKFLEEHRADICGRVLEVRDSGYTDRFGSNIASADILDIDPNNGRATIVADLSGSHSIPANYFDCFILTQTLHMIYELRAAVAQCFRLLKPGGVLLATLPSVIRVDVEQKEDGDFWRFTEASARRLFGEYFPADLLEIRSYGNVLVDAAFLYGVSSAELTAEQLADYDPKFPLLIAVRAIKPAQGKPEGSKSSVYSTTASRTPSAHRGAILCYHRIASLSPDAHGLCLSPLDFRAHIQYLCENYSLMRLEDLAGAARDGLVPDRAVALTFDDGYYDAFTTASPILSDFKVPATFFLNTEQLNEEHECWWDTLERIFNYPLLPRKLEILLRGQLGQFSTESEKQRAATLKMLNEHAWPMTSEERNEMARTVAGWSGIDCRPRESHRKLTSDEILDLSRRPGHSVGAHTVHHLALTMHSRVVRRAEIVCNKKHLERILGQPVLTFSYPYGDYDPQTIELARAAGFVAAVTVEEGLVEPGGNPMLLPRFEVKAHDKEAFAKFMTGIHSRYL